VFWRSINLTAIQVTLLLLAHYRIAPNALTVSVRSSE